MKRYFADAGYFIALLSEHDALHERAVRLARRLEREGKQAITTDAMLYEVGAFFARESADARNTVAEVLSGLICGGSLGVVHATDETLREAIHLYGTRQDKQWSLADCLSFVVMRRQGITEALSADAHFAQAGFTPLLGAEAEGPAR